MTARVASQKNVTVLQAAEFRLNQEGAAAAAPS
jgi:hypothetical protein